MQDIYYKEELFINEENRNYLYESFTSINCNIVNFSELHIISNNKKCKERPFMLVTESPVKRHKDLFIFYKNNVLSRFKVM
jgi:hypothetical protein